MSVSDYQEEVWVTLDLFPLYAVSNYGVVLNTQTNRELKPRPDSKGYLRVGLYRNGERYECYIHRLVALCFFLNYSEGVEVKHVNDADKTDNSVRNLTLQDARPCRGRNDRS